MRTWALLPHSFRGGTGKSNTTANLAALVARSGKHVGVIDTDIQSPGIHVLFGCDEESFGTSLNDFLWGKCKIHDCAHEVTDRVFEGETENGGGRLFLIPSSLKSGEIARVLREGYDVALLNDGFQTLIDTLKLDYLFVDTHPGANEETLLSIAISDLFILILRPDNQDYQGTAVTVELARRLKVRNMMILLNKVPPAMDERALKEQIEKAYQADVAALLPLHAEVAQLASRGIFSLRYPEHRFSQLLRSVAEDISTIAVD